MCFRNLIFLIHVKLIHSLTHNGALDLAGGMSEEYTCNMEVVNADPDINMFIEKPMTWAEHIGGHLFVDGFTKL
jgi:hypothetical protein